MLPPALRTTRGGAPSPAAADVYQLGGVEMVALHAEHLVSVQLTGGARLFQGRDGREQEKEVFAGEVIVTPAGNPKIWRRSGEGLVLIVSIPPSYLADLLEQLTGRPGTAIHVRDDFGTGNPRIATLAAALWQELRDDKLGAPLYEKALVEQIALHLLRDHCTLEAPDTAAVSMPPHKLRLAKAYIQENLAGDLCVENIARAVGMSAFHFAHAFRDAIGVPPHQYVMRRRMEQAKSLLRSTELPLAQVAQSVGYSSASHFCVAFRRLSHMAPRDYRRAP
jgi:AraC family transcriptional regulator